MLQTVISFSKRLIQFTIENGLIYTFNKSKSNMTVFVNSDNAVISSIDEVSDLLKSFIGCSDRALKLFYFVQNDFWSNYDKKGKFNNLKEKLAFDIKKSKLIDTVLELLNYRYSIILDDGSITNTCVSVDVIVPLVDFLLEYLNKMQNMNDQSTILYNLESALDDLINNFEDSDINYHNVDSLFKLLGQREVLNNIFKSLSLSTSFDRITFEDLKIKILFFYLKHENFIKQLRVAKHLNNYHNKKLSPELKKHITRTFILNGIIEMILGEYCNEELLNNLDDFFVFIAPSLNYSSLLTLFKIKEKANKSKLDRIERILGILVKHINPKVI